MNYAYPAMKKDVCVRLAALVLCLSAIAAAAQMVSPSIDKPGEPFSYFSKPTDEIGITDSEAATEVTPEGFLRTGFAELMFFAGPEYQPIAARVRTLEEGHLPVMSWIVSRDGVDYRFTVFGSTLTGKPGAPLVNFIRIEMRNTAQGPNRAILTTGVRYDAPNNTNGGHGDNRFDRPREPQHIGGYRQIGEAFSPDWQYSFDDNGFFRDGRLLYSYPAGYATRGWTLHGRYNYPQDISKSRKLGVNPVVPAGIVTYSRLLKPGETYTLDFAMPVVPTADKSEIAQTRSLSYDSASPSGSRSFPKECS